MSDHWPDIAGRISGSVHHLPIRIYYEDTDFSGAVYHANYLRYCERGRSDCFRLMGFQHHDVHGKSGFVVRRMVCDFLKPGRIDNLLDVETTFVEMAGARMELQQKISRGDEILFEAKVTVALVNEDGRPVRLPKDLIDRFLKAD